MESKEHLDEIWKTIPGYEGVYEVSNHARVRSLNRICCYTNRRLMGKVLATKLTLGYPTLGLHKNRKTYHLKIHRLVAQAFIPNPENKPFINHINGIRHDNRLENLEWCTAQQNMIHALETGLRKPPMGERCKLSRLKKDQVLEIIKLRGTIGVREIGRRFGVRHSTISDIHKGKTWKHISRNSQ
jgi:hypothetical protein